MFRTPAAALSIAVAIAFPLSAQQTTGTDSAAPDPAATGDQAAPSPKTAAPTGLVRATSLLDGDVYATKETGSDGQVGEPLLEVPAEWAEVGEIEDLALNADGQLEGIVVEIGGFLGLGETLVLVPADTLRSVRVSGKVYFITSMTEEEMEQLPVVDDTMWE